MSVVAILISEDKEIVRISCKEKDGSVKEYVLSSLENNKAVSSVLGEIEKLEKILSPVVLEKIDCKEKLPKLREGKFESIREKVLNKIKEEQEAGEKRVKEEVAEFEKERKKKEGKKPEPKKKGK